MLEFLRDRASDRKLRLFACACCRRAWRVIHSAEGRKAVETAARYADGRVGRDELCWRLFGLRVAFGATLLFTGWSAG